MSLRQLGSCLWVSVGSDKSVVYPFQTCLTAIYREEWGAYFTFAGPEPRTLYRSACDRDRIPEYYALPLHYSYITLGCKESSGSFSTLFLKSHNLARIAPFYSKWAPLKSTQLCQRDISIDVPFSLKSDDPDWINSRNIDFTSPWFLNTIFQKAI